jgi:hypothetical protein
MSNINNEKSTIDEMLEVNERVINLLIFTLGTIHMLSFFSLIYLVFCKFIFVPFSPKWGFIYKIGTEVSELPLGLFLLMIFLTFIGYLIVFGFLSLIIGIYQKIKLLNENLLSIAFDTNVNLRALLISDSQTRKVSRFRKNY